VGAKARHPADIIESMTSCEMDHIVTAGAAYTVTARYDNSQPHSAVIGIMLAYVWKGTPPV